MCENTNYFSDTSYFFFNFNTMPNLFNIYNSILPEKTERKAKSNAFIKIVRNFFVKFVLFNKILYLCKSIIIKNISLPFVIIYDYWK
jgi:hypothetical protein